MDYAGFSKMVTLTIWYTGHVTMVVGASLFLAHVILAAINAWAKVFGLSKVIIEWQYDQLQKKRNKA